MSRPTVRAADARLVEIVANVAPDLVGLVEDVAGTDVDFSVVRAAAARADTGGGRFASAPHRSVPEGPMGHRFLDLATSPAARAEQAARGSRAAYARAEAGADRNDRLTAAERAFVAARDSFYLASVTPDGWPYVQHRGGPAGFLRALDDRTLGFADYRGNRQYLTVGNISGDDRVALFLMDYPGRRRLKLLGRMRAVPAEDDPALAARLAGAAAPAPVERSMIVAIEAFDWNCPQHIVPRFTEAELAPIAARLAALEAENAALVARLAPRRP